jgi:hypothetical protein
MRIGTTVILFGALLALACGGDGDPPTGPGPNPNPNPEPEVGHIQVSTTTSGADLDSDGYTVAMPGAADRPIGLNGVTTFSDVEVGPHQVTLGGLADNCSANSSNPATTAVTKDATAQVGFEVECEALPIGSLAVSTSVTNNFDPDGFQVLVGGLTQGAVEVNGSATFDDLPGGEQQVELTGIAPNCLVDGDNPATVDIPVAGTASHTFSITCTSPPDGRIVYLGTDGIRTVNPDGSGSLLIWPCSACTRPRWSPDGTEIVFENDDSSGFRNLAIIPQDGSEFRWITEYDDLFAALYAEWSPDGTRVLFTLEDQQTGGHVLHVADADGTGVEPLPRVSPMFRESMPDWSPDGSKIVFWGSTEDFSESRIFIADIGGSIAEPITSAPSVCSGQEEVAWFDWQPQWSPDGSRIAYSTLFMCEPEATTNASDVRIMNADGTGVVLLTDSSEWESEPRWSPDGSRLVLIIDGIDGIAVMNSDGSGVAQVTNPGWTPDWEP